MEIKVRGVARGDTFEATITDEHGTCRCGQPVLLVDGRAYRPDDVHPVYGSIGHLRLSADAMEGGEAISNFYQPLCAG